MSHQGQHDHTAIIISKTDIENLRRGVAQAHLSLHALIELLHGDATTDQQCIAYLLSYIETGLEKSESMISGYMTPAVLCGEHRRE